MARGTINTRVKADAKEFKVEMKAVAKAIENISKQLTASNQSFGLFSKNTKGIVTDLAHLVQIGAGSISIFKEIKGIFGSTAQQFIQTADAINTMNARLKLTTTSTEHFTALRAEIDKIAKSTFSSSDTISNLFINLNQSLNEMGLSQKNALEMSETLSKALKAGGASAVDAERAITQFSQALSTGKLQGQDFKAMIQAAPSLLKNMADGLGVTTGELRAMATEGKLTNEKLVEAFSNMKASVDETFEKMPLSVADATQLMNNSIGGLIEYLNIAMSATGSMSETIKYWANALEQATPTISVFVNEVVGVFAEAVLGLEGICKSFVLAGLDVLWLLNQLNVVNGVEVDKWIDTKRAEYSLEQVAQKIEDVRAKTNKISIELYNKAEAQGDIAALNTTKEAAISSVKQVEKAVKSAKIDPLKALKEQLDAQISYFNAIKDHWGAANVELQKYEADLLEKVKKNLLSREQAEAMMQQKRIELEKSANDKILKNIESTYNEQIEFFEITGDREKQLKAMHEKAHKIADEYIKKHQITAKSAIDNTRKYFLDQEMKSFKGMDESFKDNVSSMTSSWDEMVGGMAKSIEQGLFDFITGKTGSISGAFKDIGNSILQALISPMASNFSKGVAGIFSSLLGGGENSVASIATSLGLKLENGVYRGQVDGGNVEILTDGTILSGGANLADKLGLSSGATNILSAASTLKSTASIFTSGVSGLQGSIFSSTFSPFGSVSSALNGMGLNGLGTFVNDFGTGFSNVFSFASNSGSILSGSSIFAGGMGQALGSMAGGASIGGLVGSLGDMLFGTNTKAGLGGSIGGAIGTAILPGIGTAVGSLFGSAIGGIFGSWEESDRGVQIKELVNYSSGQALSPFGFGTYVDEEKKSWFGTKERSNFELDSAGSKALNSTMKKLNTLIEDFKTNDLILPAVKITDDFKNGLNMIISTSLVSAIQNQGWLTQQATQNVFAWESAAKAQGKEVLSFMTEQISTMRTYIKALKIDTKDTFNNLKQSVKEYEKNFSTLAKDMGLGWLADINVAFIDGAALADMYSQAIKNSFDPETVANWNALIESYQAAKQAQDEYTKAIRDFSKNVYSSIISIRGAYGLNTDRLSLESVKASFYMLARDLNLITGSIEEFSQNLRDTSILDMAGFLSYDTQNRTELLGYAAQYAQLGSKALENLKSSIQSYIDEIGSINEQIAALELAKKQDELNLSKEHYTALISLYKEQKKFVDRLKGLANSLRMDVWGANEISAYYKSTLSQAKYDYANGIYDSEAVNNLSTVAKQHAQNLKATATSAEQYRFEVLQMANEIENIVPKDEVQTIMEGLELANKELDKINAKLKELIDSTQKSKDEQIAALEASKQEITKQTAELLKSNAELFGELGGDFESGFGELASAFELVASSIDKSFKGLAEQLKTTASEANKDSSYYSPDLSWDELSSTINSYYQEYFGRNAEYKGLNYWYQAVASGLHSLSAIERQILDVGANITNENLTDEAYERLRQLGIHKFADGGIVTGPTNALIGEAGYPEAVIPLKDGAGLKIDTSGIFERLENRMLTMEQKLKMLLEKIEKNTNELNRTLSGVTDGDVLYINGKVKVS